MFSTVEGYHEYRGGYLEYRGDTQYRGGYHDARGGYHDARGGYQEYCGVFSTMGENLLLFESPTILNNPTVLKLQRMVSPRY